MVTLVLGQRRAILKAGLSAHDNTSKDVPAFAPLLATGVWYQMRCASNDAGVGRRQRAMLHTGDSAPAAVEEVINWDAGLEVPMLSTQHARAGRQDAVLGRVHQRLRFMCEARQEPVPHIGDVVSAAARLGAKRLALCDPASLRLRMQ